MIKILKASAGSGKTFSLAGTYIRLLLENDDPRAYRHILAVTFTNKATDEMKSRILKELHLLSTDPGKSGYTKDLLSSRFRSEDEVRRKARLVLMGILHDYSAFSVSTIDRFFQQTLKAFSREIGQFASYQVELDKDSLVSESVDRILDSLTEDDKGLLKWLTDSMMEQLEQGRRFNLEGSLTDMAKRLKSDEHRSVTQKHGIDEGKAYSKENLSRMKALLKDTIKSYASDVKAAARAVEEAFESCGLSPFDTSRGFMGSALSKFAAMDERSGVPLLSEGFLRKAPDYDSWFRKADQKRYASYQSALAPPVGNLVDVCQKGLKTYNTARILIGQINDLGIASELQGEFQNLLKEKNVLSIDDSNMILKEIIDGSDAPFVYEKLGVRFEHFLLDEFQDTSRVQWDNFRPLIANSDSQGLGNLLVGDIKQSIYRWRGSDWKLMGGDVAEEFPGAIKDKLGGNWRSLRGLVEFNNEFFAFAAAFLDSIYDGPKDISVSSIYGKKDDGTFERQIPMTKDGAPGSVEAIFCESGEQETHILETLRRVRNAGARDGDITILVRNNQEGSLVAAFLMENGIDVISDDSLRLKSSFIVRKLVSLIASVRNPGETIGSYLAKQSGLDAGKVSFQSLPDLCERLLRILAQQDAEAFERETMYIQSFMDFVQDHVRANGNSLDIFLKAWEKADPKLSSPADADAVRVMTIHKSKGLEFPYVILPYSEKVGLFRARSAWTVPKVKGTPLESIGEVAFDVPLSGGSEQTLFNEDYQKEKLLQYIDNINTYYVALTRASKGMTIISDIGATAQKNFAGILRQFLEEKGDENGFGKVEDPSGILVVFNKGILYDFNTLTREEESLTRHEPGYPSFPLNPDGEDGEGRTRLRICPDSADFFSEEGKARAQARQNGTVLHGILSDVKVPSDLEAAVDKAVRGGLLDPSQGTEVTSLLSERIAAHPEWFPPSGAGVFNEVSLIDTDGREWRPDRVVIREGAVTVIDYKFGEKDPRYRRQVSKYASIYRRLGHERVSTAIWYVFTDEVE